MSPSSYLKSRAARARRQSAEYVSLAPTPALPFPLILQRRAPQTVRRHARGAFIRVGTLVAADLAILVLARVLFRGISDVAWLGPETAYVMRTLVPHGALPFLELFTGVLVGLLLLGNYRSGDHRRDTRTLTLGAFLGVGLTAWGHVWSGMSWPMLLGALGCAAALSTALVIGRLAVDAVVRRVRLARGHAMRVVVVGTQPDVAHALATAALSDPAEYHVVGFVDSAPVPSPEAIGGVREIVSVMSRWRVDTLVLASSLDEPTTRHLVHVADAAGCQVLMLPRTLMLDGFAPRLMWCRGVPLVQITRPSLRGHQLVMKRALDLTVSVALLALLSPLLLGIALAVRLSSPGPVFFRQVRVGRGGRQFRIAKFRSMVVDAEARLPRLRDVSVYGDARLFKVEHDPRATRIGAFLRRTSLDELPQLWNVLKGEMSLVGPRPPIPSEVALYDDHHYSRFDVKPGITGPWQVSGRNQIRDFEEVVRLEMAYIRQWGIGKDVGILLRTLPAVLRMDGAY